MNKQLITWALEAGADKAFVLPTSEIPFDAGLRAFCEANRCGQFNRNYACPPAVGASDELIAQARSCQWALVYQTISPLEDSFDVEGMMDAADQHKQLTRALHEKLRNAGFDGLPLSVGGCSICPRCAKADNLPCRFPLQRISSLEAYCINVSQLAEKCAMKYINGANTVTYFGAILF